MPDCSTAQLIGYLLNALEEEEREQIEQELRRRPELRKRLQRLKERLAILELGRVEVLPPRGLAERTCQRVLKDRQVPSPGSAVAVTAGLGRRYSAGGRQPCGFRLSPLADYWAGQRPGWSFADLAVGGLVMLIVVSLLFPALAEVRFRFRVLACRDNCRELFQAIHHYQNVRNLQGPAGIVRANMAMVEQLAGNSPWRPMLHPCPGAVPEMGHNRRANSFQNATFFTPLELIAEDVTGGLYGYVPLKTGSPNASLPVEQVSLAALPLWRDCPDPRDCGGWSWNHEGRGENWLFADGHVAFLPRSEKHVDPPKFGVTHLEHAALSGGFQQAGFGGWQFVSAP